MPYIVNQTFFVGDINIPNLHNTYELSVLNTFIAKYEPDCLIKILGYPLFKLMGVETSQRMTDLLNGAEYTDGMNETKNWQGLTHDNLSLIASYVYFYFERSKAQQSTGTGTVVKTPLASVATSPMYKMESAWNFFSEETLSLICFLWLKKDGSGQRVYPEFSYHQFLESKRISRKINSIFEL